MTNKNYSEYRIVWEYKNREFNQDKPYHYNAQWHSLKGIFVNDLDLTVKWYSRLFPDREFWVEYR